MRNSPLKLQGKILLFVMITYASVCLDQFGFFYAKSCKYSLNSTCHRTRAANIKCVTELISDCVNTVAIRYRIGPHTCHYLAWTWIYYVKYKHLISKRKAKNPSLKLPFCQTPVVKPSFKGYLEKSKRIFSIKEAWSGLSSVWVWS